MEQISYILSLKIPDEPVFNHLAVGIKHMNVKANDYMKDYGSWAIVVGGNYRHWLGKSFYIEARAGVQ